MYVKNCFTSFRRLTSARRLYFIGAHVGCKHVFITSYMSFMVIKTISFLKNKIISTLFLLL